MPLLVGRQRSPRQNGTEGPESLRLLEQPVTVNNRSEPVVSGSVSPEVFLFTPTLNLGSAPTTPEVDTDGHLVEAIQNGDIILLERLLGTGIDPNKPVDHWKFVEDHGGSRSLRTKATPLCLAAERNQAACIDLLLKSGADPDIFTDGKSYDDLDETDRGDRSSNRISDIALAPLHLAAIRNSTLAIQALVNGDAKVDIQDAQGRTPLLVAASPGNVEAMEKLLKLGAAPDSRDNSGLTALQIVGRCLGTMKNTKETAVFVSKYIEAALLLLKNGADYSIVDTDSNRTLLHQAAISGNAEIVAEILKQQKHEDGTDFVDAVDKNGRTSLYLSAYYGTYECIELLVQAGADLLHRDENGTTIMEMIITLQDGVQCLEKILDGYVTSNDVDPSERNFGLNFDFTPLFRRKEKNQTLMLETIINLPIKENPLLQHPLIESFLTLKWQKVKYMHFAQIFLYLCLTLGITLLVVLAITPTKTEQKIGGGVLFLISRWVLLGLVFILVCIQETIHVCALGRQYFKEIESYNKIALLSCSAILIISQSKYDWLVYVAATFVFLGWTELMILVGRLPLLGAYNFLFSSIIVKMLKFIAAFFLFICGFVICAYILLENEMRVLLGILHALGKVTEDLKNYQPKNSSASNLTTSALETSSNFLPPEAHNAIRFLFLMLALAVLLTLLIGLAVSDIAGLLKVGKIERLRKQGRHIIHLESIYYSKVLRPFWVKTSWRFDIDSQVLVYPSMGKAPLPEHICASASTICRERLLTTAPDMLSVLDAVREDSVKLRKEFSELKEHILKELKQIKASGKPSGN